MRVAQKESIFRWKASTWCKPRTESAEKVHSRVHSNALHRASYIYIRTRRRFYNVCTSQRAWNLRDTTRRDVTLALKSAGSSYLRNLRLYLAFISGIRLREPGPLLCSFFSPRGLSHSLRPAIPPSRVETKLNPFAQVGLDSAIYTHGKIWVCLRYEIVCAAIIIIIKSVWYLLIKNVYGECMEFSWNCINFKYFVRPLYFQ